MSAAAFMHPRKEIGSDRKFKERPPQPNSALPFGLSHLLILAQKEFLPPSPNYCQAHPDPNDMCSDQPIFSLAGHDAHQKPPLSLSPNNEPLEFSTPNPQIQAVPLPMPIADTSTPPKPEGDKQKAIPTRRSQRILEKRSTFCPEQKSAKKSKSQATGLTINGKIEEIITEAVKQDQHMEDTDKTRPTTPLHDPIPPFAVPGTDLLL